MFGKLAPSYRYWKIRPFCPLYACHSSCQRKQMLLNSYREPFSTIEVHIHIERREISKKARNPEEENKVKRVVYRPAKDVRSKITPFI